MVQKCSQSKENIGGDNWLNLERKKEKLKASFLSVAYTGILSTLYAMMS